MPFPGTSQTSLAGLWNLIKTNSGAIKDRCVQLQAASSLSRMQLLAFQNSLADILAALDSETSNATTNGLLSYAQSQENNPTLDLVGTYTTMRTQIVALQDWVVTNFPKDASGNLVVFSFDGNKKYVDVPLLSSELSAYKTQLSLLANTIN